MGSSEPGSHRKKHWPPFQPPLGQLLVLTHFQTRNHIWKGILLFVFYLSTKNRQPIGLFPADPRASPVSVPAARSARHARSPVALPVFRRARRWQRSFRHVPRQNVSAIGRYKTDSKAAKCGVPHPEAA